ncbi:histidine phosphatase family protein [Clostridium sp. WILCCON 0269]|uniref:phosphoglycerate mutase (2,3-diphosphoglycerate-dependent) n=1 Tax=Candidatus Clostridium eludens TaxID=3381663 RepID=A0ABW8SS66_9CLOT
MELLLIRHGCCENNGCIAGYFDFPLSTKGIYQAKILGEYLRESKVKLIYTSPLIRSVSTAKLIGYEIGVKPISLPELKERSAGIFEGLTISGALKKHPQEWNRTWSNPLVAPLNGESYKDVAKRVLRVLDILKGIDEGKVAVVSHEGFLNIFLNILLGLEPKTFPMFKLDNTSISSVFIDKLGKITINYINKIEHLKMPL